VSTIGEARSHVHARITYESGPPYSWKTGKKYIGSRPSWKAISSLRNKIHELTAADKGWKNASTVAKEINLVVRGWAALLQR
jgi:hypothetical protein